MVSNVKECTEETHGDHKLVMKPSTHEIREHIGINMPPIQARLPDQRSHTRRLLDFLKATPPPGWIKKLRLSFPPNTSGRTVDEGEEISVLIPSPIAIRPHFHIHFVRRINWTYLRSICKEWMENPMNIALLIWLICVAISASMLGLLLVGLLDQAFPTKSSRNHWIEINNQVLNALFTLMSLYQHPKLFHHLVLLCRWRSEDIIALRKIYCKNGAYRPREWAHILVVLILLHITCFVQYVLCGLYWGYTRTQRPEFAEDFFLALGIAAPAFAGAYTVYGPLGRQCDTDSDEESNVRQSTKFGLKLSEGRVVVSRPEWIGGLFDCIDDITVGYLSFFCTCCVFGWNMERLGFGNMYVHIVTFLLLCVAPFWIFNISALNIHDEVIGDIVGISGVMLCVFGLLYGGFWRIQMRKRFKLPGNTFCCGSESLTDYMQWMFCWACSLAQEVRTGNFYDVEDDSLYRKHVGNDEQGQAFLQILPSNDSTSPAIIFDPISPLPNSNATGTECAYQDGELHDLKEASSKVAFENTMKPPVQPSMELEKRISDEDAIEPPDSPLVQRKVVPTSST